MTGFTFETSDCVSWGYWKMIKDSPGGSNGKGRITRQARMADERVNVNERWAKSKMEIAHGVQM